MKAGIGRGLGSSAVVAGAALLAGALLGGAGAARAADEVVIGESTTLSGSISELGETGRRGIQMLAERINAEGGLLGKKVRVVSADDGASPANGVTNMRHMILADKAVAIFGPVSSAVATAEESVAAQYHELFFTHTSNDIKMTTSNFTKYYFQLVPNTVMEPRAPALFLAQRVGKGPITLGTITPDYSYGRDTVDAFIEALRRDGVEVKVVVQQYPKLGATDFTSYISALLAARPQYVFMGIYGGDLITFTKQARNFDFFRKTKAITGYTRSPLKALDGQAPGGSYALGRAPFWAVKGPGMEAFNRAYYAKYKDWPSAWAIMAYTAGQAWAYGVRKAASFDSDKVAAALGGATVPTIRGPLTLRACDHQANVPEYVGVVADAPDPRYGYPIWSQTEEIAASKLMLTCEEVEKLRRR